MFKGKITLLLGASLIGWTAVASLPVEAANEAMIELLKVLRENGTISEEAYEQLQSASKADDEHNTEAQQKVEQAAQTLPKIETKGKLEWSTPDGEFSWRLGGRIHLDTAFYDNDRGTTDSTTLTSGTDIRRARLEVLATLWRNWQFSFGYDFGQTSEVREGFRDMFIRYLLKGPQPFTFTAGQFKEYLGLESLTSSNDTTFMERAMPSRAFHDLAEGSDGRRIGFGVSTNGHELWTASVGAFSKNASGDSSDDQTDPIVFDGRLTFSPIHTDTRIVHLGFAGSWMDPNGSNRVSFAARPEARIGADRLISISAITGTDEVVRYGVEAAGVYGPFSLQGEYLLADVSRDLPGQPDVNLDGWYLFGSWVLTGESRGYEFERGVFKNPKPYGVVGKGGIGAWEVAARYSTLDLNDGGINGGEEKNITVGLNWYPTPNFKFMANYVKVLDLDIEGSPLNGAEPDIFEFRAQAYW
jgi:phosphate-selective porin OprO and OprP